MTIDKAIEILEKERREHHSLNTDVIGQAEALSIEALKVIKIWQATLPLDDKQLLPGETQD